MISLAYKAMMKCIIIVDPIYKLIECRCKFAKSAEMLTAAPVLLKPLNSHIALSRDKKFLKCRYVAIGTNGSCLPNSLAWKVKTGILTSLYRSHSRLASTATNISLMGNGSMIRCLQLKLMRMGTPTMLLRYGVRYLGVAEEKLLLEGWGGAKCEN